MRLLVFSDLHSEEAALEGLRSLAAKGRFDCVLSCGDISRSESFAEEALAAFRGTPLYAVPGNWDSEGVGRLVSGHPGYAHGRRFELGGGLNLVGFGYSPITPFHTFGELQDPEIYSRMRGLPIDGSTILLLHCPPMGHFDAARGGHAGSESILRIIGEKKPLAAFFGHIHEHAGVSRLGDTTLIKVPPANSMKACVAQIGGRAVSAEFVSI